MKTELVDKQKEKTGNELIAEFMGWEPYSQNSYKCPNIYPIENSTSMGWTTFTADQLEFGTRWDWLMPVVEKIEKTGDGFISRVTGCSIEGFLCDFVDQTNTEIALQFSQDSKIEAVYKAVVQFITWYNTQKESPLLNQSIV